jgi:hypothetical protein
MDRLSKNLTDAVHAKAVVDDITLTPKAAYRVLCETEGSIPIFSKDWWLDAVVGEQNWDVVVVRTNGRIVGAMPFATTRRYGMIVIHQPPLTPLLGAWISPSGEKTSSRLGNEQRVLQSLIDQLPRFDNFRQTCNKDFSNWLPFYWNGFSQTTEYTYVVNHLDNLELVWSEFDSARRKHCRQGAERFTMKEDISLDDFLCLHKMTLDNRGVSQSFTDDSLRRLDAACIERKCRKIHIAVDDAGRHCSGTYTVWDGNCAYALMKGSDPQLQNTGAPSFCQWQAIRFSSTVASKYDFLGNMNPLIEPYVRSFGAKQTPIFTITKTPSRLLRLRQGLKLALASNH